MERINKLLTEYRKCFIKLCCSITLYNKYTENVAFFDRPNRIIKHNLILVRIKGTYCTF